MGVARRVGDRWEAHPVLAGCVRLLVLLVPVLASLLVAWFMVSALPEPEGGVGALVWWVAVLGPAFLAAGGVDHLARQALPLAALLQLSLVFPDRAPSRLRTARRTSLRELERQVEALEAAGRRDDAAEAARRLVALVGALGRHDPRTRGHSERTRAYVDLISEELRLPEEDRERLRWSALIHDIGKLSVPGTVLNGGSDLHDEEWDALRAHPVVGEELAAGLLPWLGEWGRCVREHHERWDGSGYPHGLAGTDISLGARIVAVADAYEVMTANRSYQKAVSPAAARVELARCAGKDFDPAVVRAFLQVSLGRLRGVLGVWGFLPAVPLVVLGNRAGDAAKGLTTVAASGALALTLTSTPAAAPEPTPVLSAPVYTAPVPVASATPPPVLVAHPAPAPSPSPRAAARVASPSRTAVQAAVAPSRAARRTAPPLADVLFLSSGAGLTPLPPSSGQVRLLPGTAGATFEVAVPGATAVSGAPTVVLLHRLETAKGGGNPRTTLTAVLRECVASRCTTLGSGTAQVRTPAPDGWQRTDVRLSRFSRTIAAGHVLRLQVSVDANRNVSGVVVSCGGSPASRLLLP